MSFIDEITLHLKAGHGGDGVVRWMSYKGKPRSGPGGGNGGNGGNVVLRAVRDLTILERYIAKKKFQARDGEEGRNFNEHGANGDDLVFDVPIGSFVTRVATGDTFDLTEEGQEVQVLKGGKGGLGNRHFRGSTNTTPQESTPGKPGEAADFHIELRLVVDAGLVGLPSAGKSSLLNALTGTHAKVAAYSFTTLEPHLGMLYGRVLADIPGLIEGAHEGKGLGHTFLRHIARTKTIIHCVSLENNSVVNAYDTIRHELESYSQELAEKPELIVLTKTDLVSEEVITQAQHALATHCEIETDDILTVSIHDEASLKHLSDILTKVLSA